MKFKFEVGELKKNQIEYDFNQFLGRLVIKLNQKEIKRTIRLVNEPVKETHVVQAQGDEKWTVEIEKERKPLVGQRCRVMVNGRLYKCFAGV